jgi:hypothetical protein
MIRRILNGLSRFRELVSEPRTKTFYPDEPRKSQMRIVWDNVMWVLKHREINHFYYLWGFDRASFDRPDKYLPEQAFCRMRDKANACRQFGTHRARYICMLQDKFVFGQYLKALGFTTPPVIALCDRDGLDWIASGKRLRWAELTQQENLDGFLKDALGRCGKAVYPIRSVNGRLLVNGSETTPEALRSLIDGKYIIQERIVQHPEMNRLYPHAVNTIRFITLRREDEIELVSGTFRMGAGGNPWDNWSSGGIGVGMNIETGRLNKKGMFRSCKEGMISEHPETKVRFDTFKIPFYREAAELVKELHTFFYGVHSIGWDVAITEKGPSIIEANNSWCIGFQQIHDSGIKQKFLASLNERE